MKTLLVLALSLTTASAFGKTLNWSDLEAGVNYTLNADIPMEEAGLKLEKGSVLVLSDSGQGEAPVIYLVFKNLSCTDSALKSEMALFNPEPQDVQNDKSIGVELEENCEVSIYVEPQFFSNVSVLDGE